jgi:hypothetical protein
MEVSSRGGKVGRKEVPVISKASINMGSVTLRDLIIFLLEIAVTLFASKSIVRMMESLMG